MNKQSIALKVKVFTLSVIVLVAFVIIYSTKLIYNKNSFYPTVNKGRLLTSSIKISVEEALGSNNSEFPLKTDFPYAAIGLNGKVLYSSISIYEKDAVANLNEFMEYDNKASLQQPGLIKYTTPLIINSNQVGTAIFLIPKEDFLSTSPKLVTFRDVLPIIIALSAIIILIILTYILLKKDILLPLDSLNESARRILKGDFTYEIHYDYDTEMGVFCHDFEAMRDELKFSKKKEISIKVSEKELLACLSHDIKTPLTAIHGYVSGIKDGIVKDKAGIENYCIIILNRVKMLSKLLEDILEHSKAELNKMNISLVEFYCGDFFKDILDDLSVEITSKEIHFIFPDKIPNLLLNGDKKRLSQVMYNLVSNSIKYSREDGSISIYFENTGRYLNVYIKDTGMGISSADIPYIFNKFYRAEKCRNQNIPGSGLGLSISKYIVEAHGGFINCVESSLNGTIICFGIPI
ncbi:HAMP domain-containing histidine kinase [Clostridium sp. CM028]|uniref:HAMP domain-containing sensor histidine kinase n=1 Tax=Clostridium sp. CM028 TaxID=2851575 RepID=UPI001C6DFABB|nr:HAMP domain-containing sensor histidine kinase [Clostridium sp. CM028]MBW9148175.1 HAMP domain-containing histidine kinase [Clostridium sp. CM028]WLC62290.1 HAMP domain-containing histidine kinase [Clostridium sp. CM028]